MTVKKKIEEDLERVTALLREETTLALATADEDGRAEAAPLFFWTDEALALYWLSSPESRHSFHLQSRSDAAVTVYRQAATWKEICGVQMQGQVGTITEPERRKAVLKSYCERFNLGGVFSLAIRKSVLYIFEPEWIRYLDNGKRFGYKFELERSAEGWRTPAVGPTSR
jgi:hypothetical protein